MTIKGITDEDFINYKLPSMFIATGTCSFKCEKECGKPICHNNSLINEPSIDVSDENIIERYKNNPITHAIVFGGLEPFDQFLQILKFVSELREAEIKDDVVIYTGYNKDELEHFKVSAYTPKDDCFIPKIFDINCIEILSSYENIVIKYGRFIPDQRPHFDHVLGVNLASDNQYAERIKYNKQ